VIMGFLEDLRKYLGSVLVLECTDQIQEIPLKTIYKGTEITLEYESTGDEYSVYFKCDGTLGVNCTTWDLGWYDPIESSLSVEILARDGSLQHKIK